MPGSRPGPALRTARRLRAGDTVAVIAPAGPVEPEVLDAGVAVLRGWGLAVRVLGRVLARHERFSYLAGTDAERAADLTAVWSDPEVAGVFCARGGYGCQRMVDLLDWPALRGAGDKVLLGFSDVTALHQAVATRLGLSTVHGPNVGSLATVDEPSRQHLRRLLFDAPADLTLTSRPGTGLHPGTAEGVLVGGNLALLAAEVGTATCRTAAGGIAVLEDVGEQVYRLDRLLTQLLRAGWFRGVRGIAAGQFTGCGSPESVRALFEDRLLPLGVPMLRDLPVGHTERNLAFALGVTGLLDADAGTLALTEPPLA